MDKRISRQPDQSVSGSLCCSRKKTLQNGIRAHMSRLLPPSWAEKDFLPLEKNRQIGDQTPASSAPSPSQAGRQCTPVPVWAPGLCFPWAWPPPPCGLPFIASYSLWQKNQWSCYDTKRKIPYMSIFFVWPIMFPRKNFSDGRPLQSWMFYFSLFGKQVPCRGGLVNTYNLKQNTGNSLSNYWRWQ